MPGGCTPIKSKAQWGALFAKAGKGEVSKKTVLEKAHKTTFKSLPEKKRSKK